ncbi:MAG: hypothetical protein B7Y85_00575 [Brevundimonas sp. 32-68-21]|nr:MAG: hypothetical protein B7Y85_00575 [Brevundimonas sp. 32-68-21]
MNWATSPPPACWRTGSTRPNAASGSCSRSAVAETPDSLAVSFRRAENSAMQSREAFLAASNPDIDCVISDMQMPGMNGLALQHRIVAERPDLPVIFMTAFPDELTRSRAMAAGAGCYLEKPCSADALSRCLDRALHPETRQT